MSRTGARLFIFILTLLFTLQLAHAQDEEPQPLPEAFTLYGFTYIPQTWNNCGPATLTMGLTYFGWPADQQLAADYLKPNYEDKNVSPWQMVDYVNTYVSGVGALLRVGGTLDTIRTMLVNEFPILIESGYDPVEDDQGWMGHYLLIVGYDDATETITTYDSFDGQNYPYTYAHVEEFWTHFNRTYIVLYQAERESLLLTLLGTDADERQNAINALEQSRGMALDDPTNAFAWHNMGSNFVALGMYQEGAVAFDQARTVGVGLPWRMFWYQFGALEAYLAVGRYTDVIAIAQANLNDGGGQYVEETYYYAGQAREGMGELERAMSNYNAAIDFNPNFFPAIEARDALQQRMNGG
ncbi:MAG: C39 family peptidase [Chloroflexi bacterium]|nr:C39 family peptidase [Chloroflexota bacterium]